MEVINRSDSSVTYTVEDLRVRRTFAIGEKKEISEQEVNALFQQDGGAELIKHYLLVNDKEWVRNHMPNAPIEYFWQVEDIKKCLLEDDVDLFSETLDYAPDGVLDLIKTMAWRLPLNDLNKVEALRLKTGFDPLVAAGVMKQPTKTTASAKPTRRRREEG